MQVLELDEALLLDDLCVDVRRPHGSDLCHQVIPDAFYSLQALDGFKY